MKKLFILALAVVLALLPVSAMAFTELVEVESPIEMELYPVDYQEGPFGLTYALPEAGRAYMKNEHVALLLEISVPKEVDTETLTIQVEGDGFVVDAATCTIPEPGKSSKQLITGRVTGEPASITATISDGTVLEEIPEAGLTIGAYTVKKLKDRYTINDNFIITLKNGRGEELRIQDGDTELTAVQMGKDIAFISSDKSVLPGDADYRYLLALYTDVCEAFGLALEHQGNPVPERYFLAMQEGGGDTSVTAELPLWEALLVVPDAVVIDPPKTGDGHTMMGFVMMVLAVTAWGCRRWAR